MEINLQTVREVLRGTFGRDSFVASFIKKVCADANCPTAGIDAQGVMQYNPSFVERHVTSPADLFCLVTHELMHPMFGHFVYRNGQLEIRPKGGRSDSARVIDVDSIYQRAAS